ncbi:hypothetical protein GCM10020000_25050 [Streptomyces olivoverticillatus]
MQLVVLTAAGSALVPVTSIGLNAEIASLDAPERLRMFSVYSMKLHAASAGSMLLLPALLQRAPKASFALGGMATAAAALFGWAVLTSVGRRQSRSPGREAEVART